jgi:hypothetical protein
MYLRRSAGDALAIPAAIALARHERSEHEPWPVCRAHAAMPCDWLGYARTGPDVTAD